MKENKKNLINNFMEKIVGQETLLWYDKPSLTNMFKLEAKYVIQLCVFFPLSIIFVTVAIHELWIRILFLTPSYILIVCRIVEWLIRKRNTYFVLTDKQAVIIYRKDGRWMQISKPFDEIRHCDIENYHNSTTIYIGKYRFNKTNPYNYYTNQIDNIEFNQNILRNQFIQYIYSLDYFSFFDLRDSTLPVQIIRDQMMINKKKEERNIDT